MLFLKVFNSREQREKQGDVKWNTGFLVAALKMSNLRRAPMAQW